MKKTTMAKKVWWKSALKFILIACISIGVVIGGWKITLHLVGDETRETMLAIEDKIDSFFAWPRNAVLSLFGKEVKDDEEVVSFEGAKLSQLTKLNMNEYIDFTIPYTWTFGRINANDESVQEAIAITGDNVVMSVFLKSVEIKSDEENLIWTEETSLRNLQSTYKDYYFNRSNMFEKEIALIEGTPKQGDVKIYMAVIPKGEQSVWVTYAYKADDWVADLYFTSVISEMLEKNV